MPKKIPHITIEHVYYLLQSECFLTFKADGVYRERKEFNGLCEYEILDDRRELIFDFINNENKNKNIIERMTEYCNLIDFEVPIFEDLNEENIFNVIDSYINFYISLPIYLEKIPKFYLKISDGSKLSVMKILLNYFPQINFPTDGWIITPNESKFSAKIKPIHELTIDLKYIKKSFRDSEGTIYSIQGNSLKNGTIYRCYFDGKKWLAREERTDKKYPNPKFIVDSVMNHITNKLNLDSINIINLMNPYYDKNRTILNDETISMFKHIKHFSLIWLLDCKDKLVLDMGCGKSSSILLWKEISPKEIVGVDIDPICIFRSTAMSNNNKYIWLNMNTGWNISSQIEYFGQVWEHTQLFKYSNFQQRFDIIVFNFSIHYCTNYELLIYNLSQRSSEGTILKFNWINYENITCFNVNIIDDEVTIDLPWKSDAHKEPLFRYSQLCEQLISNNWELINQNKLESYFDLYENWQQNLIYDTWMLTV